MICLEETASSRIIRGLGYWPSTGRMKIRTHVIRVGESGGGRADFRTHISDGGKPGTRLRGNAGAKVLENPTGSALRKSAHRLNY